MTKIFSFLTSILLFSLSSFAQGDWKSKGPIFKGNGIVVEIDFLIEPQVCSSTLARSKYRFRLAGKPSKEFYINWRMDYYNCQNQLVSANNYVRIEKGTAAVLENSAWEFPGVKMANFFYDILESQAVELRETPPRKYKTSLEPIAILGSNSLSLGEISRLSLSGGSLGEGATWKWYTDICGSNLVGTGEFLDIKPNKTTTYFTRAEGSNTTACVSKTVMVSDINQAAEKISGTELYCRDGSGLTLAVDGGKLSSTGKWVWYAGSCDGTKVGEGNSINVTPEANTLYFVRAEGAADVTECRSFLVRVGIPSEKARAILGPDREAYQKPIQLSVSGGRLGTNAQWVWYEGSEVNRKMIQRGPTVYDLKPSQSTTYLIRAEGDCGNSEFIYKHVEISTPKVKTVDQKPEPRVIKPLAAFINAGAVENNFNQLSSISNFSLTAGLGNKAGFYGRIKFSSSDATASYERSGVDLINYSKPGYYKYNGQASSKRAGYTAGGFVGGKVLSFYAGAGYGTRDLLWGIGEFSYQNNVQNATSWVRNTTTSYSGTEAEAGVLIRASFINIMGGVSTINFNYIDAHAGIGFNIK